MFYQFEQELQYSPTPPRSTRSPSSNKLQYRRSSSNSAKDIVTPDYSKINSHYVPPSPKTSVLSPTNFIRIHVPHKHIIVLVSRSTDTLQAAIEALPAKDSVTNLRAYTPVCMTSKEPCSWNITLNRLRESDIELQEKNRFEHSFESVPTARFVVFSGARCIVCDHRIYGAHKRCVSCGHNYHNRCCIKAPECTHPIVEFMKHFAPDRSNDHQTSAQTRTKEFSPGLPSTPKPVNISIPKRPNLNKNHEIVRNPSKTPSPTTSKPNSDRISDSEKPKPIREWEIRPEDLINHGRMVGKGTYGTVYKAEVRLHGYVALKELNFDSPTPIQFQAFRNEVLALKKISHQNTLNFYGYILSPRFAIVTQWCEGSTLYNHIHILDRHWEVSQWIDIARQICQGMSYLHDRGIIHRDLKSANVFLEVSVESDDVEFCQQVKIGDFGLAAVKTVVTEPDTQQTQPTGSVLWMAPEVIQQKDPNCYSPSSDVYAYGCILFEMFSGNLPHAPIKIREQIMWLVGKGKLKIKIDQCRSDTPKAIVELIRRSTEFDREQRPEFFPEIEEILSKFKFRSQRLQRSKSEPCSIFNHEDDQLSLMFDRCFNFEAPRSISCQLPAEFCRSNSSKNTRTNIYSHSFDSPI